MKIVKKFDTLALAIQEIYQQLSFIDDKNACFDIDDTIVFDDYRNTPNVQVVQMVLFLQKNGYNVHFITARVDNAEMRQQTKKEIKNAGITLRAKDSLSLCPNKNRDSMVDISAWKFNTRKSIKHVAVTVGDQWGDSVQIHAEDDIDKLDKLCNTKMTPWIVLQPDDGVAVLGLKLMS
jgi:hypothetical protein